ncbi:NlpC/P60 family protein [Neobacillus niacini]|uniref:C40 family peptidase n=1 Tax=Neobacillus niacini TaxID=86668 RepID=UPI00285C592E|nr:NlpC/P60 family protein [Neobacillus niacini]MDR7000272.1 cell wall-associated NlpC family hydrolase [Neobacillus niacini]
MKLIRFIFIMMTTALFLTIGFIPKAFADTENLLPSTKELPPIVQHTLNELSLEQVKQSLEINRNKLKQTDSAVKAANLEAKNLKRKISQLKDTMKKRNTLLKERAKAYQQSGVNVQYLDVLLGSTSFKDFVERAGAVSTIVMADKELLNQQAEVKKEYEDKKNSLKDKLAEYNDLKVELINMKTVLKTQQKQYKKLATIHKETPRKPASKSFEKLKDFENVPKKGSIQTVINAGYKYIGNSVYVFGGGRSVGDIANGRFDCSGFVHWAFDQAGIEVGSTTDSLKNDGKQISFSEIQPGDLVFFDTYKKDGHVGIYLGNGKFIGSQNNTGVAIEDLTKGYWKQTFNGRVVRI